LKLPILERGIRVTNGLGNFDGPIAEWNIMMMLMWQREMLDQLANQNNKVWDRSARYQRDLYKSTIGFWGYGGIARETARLAKAMHLDVWVMTAMARSKTVNLSIASKARATPRVGFPIGPSSRLRWKSSSAGWII